jgi:hypothetical protein
MLHDNQGFTNYKDLVIQILEEVEDLQDYPYNLSKVISMISGAYGGLGEDFPKGLAYKSSDNLCISWSKSPNTMALVYIDDVPKEGVKLRFLNKGGVLNTVPFYLYDSPDIALFDVLKRVIVDN